MITISWNCQGLGLPWKVRFLQDMISQEKPNCIFLCETLSNNRKMEEVRKKLGFEGMVVVEARGRSGGLAMLWKEADHADLLSFSTNHIDMVIKNEEHGLWRLTGFYGEPIRSQKKKSWDLLRNLARDSNLPGCVIGDMNNVTAQHEKKGGAEYPRWLVDGFNDTLTDTGLQDIELTGHQYTWEKGRDTEAWIEIRLDRVLVNNLWLAHFPLAKLYNLEGSPSDHSPLLLEPMPKVSTGKKKRFRFKNAWLTEPLCAQIVRDSWEDAACGIIVQRIAQCGRNLEVWGREITGCFNKRIKECKTELKNLRSKRNDHSRALYKQAKQTLHLILDKKRFFGVSDRNNYGYNQGIKTLSTFMPRVILAGEPIK